MKRIYLDHGSSTPLDPAVMEEMKPFFMEKFGNASSLHEYGKDAFYAIEDAREKVSDIINAKSDEIIFTSGGTESDNLAIKGLTFKNKTKKESKGYNIVTSEIEHPAVLETCNYLEKIGYNVRYLPVDRYGFVDLEELEKSISDDTFLITIMYANNEIGTIEPVKEIGKIANKHNVIFHTDAVQAIGKVPIDVNSLNIDMLSISSHKIYGPKGCGALYIKNGTKIQTISHGGGHERGLRSSTYNTPGIVGLGKACELSKKRMKKDNEYMTKLRDYLIKEVLKIEESFLNGHPKKRLSNNAHFRFSAIEGESLNMMLNDKGIASATGSACSSKKLRASHVLTGIGLKPEQAHGSLRISLGRQTKEEEIEYTANVLPDLVTKLRKMSPLWKK